MALQRQMYIYEWDLLSFKLIYIATVSVCYHITHCLDVYFVDATNYYYHMTGNEQEPRPTAFGSEPRQISSRALLGTNKELVILHNGRAYRLRLTKNGKLILTA